MKAVMKAPPREEMEILAKLRDRLVALERTAPHPKKGEALPEAVELMADLLLFQPSHPEVADKKSQLEVRLLDAHPYCE